MGITKSLVLVITPLMFLICGAVCSHLSVQPVFASPPAYCFEHDCPERLCDNNPAKGTATCCWKEPGVIPHETKCQTCHVNTSTGEFENCTSVLSKGKPDSSIIAPPPSGVAPPPPPGPGKGGPGNVLPEEVFEEPETAPTAEGPTELTPQVDCAQNPEDPLCDTAKIPEAGDEVGGDDSEDSSSDDGDSSPN